MYAIWKHDLFPYILCDKIVRKFPKTNRVMCEHFSAYTFEPIKVISDKKGEALKYLIDEIQLEKREESANLDRKYNDLFAYRKMKILGL